MTWVLICNQMIFMYSGLWKMNVGENPTAFKTTECEIQHASDARKVNKSFADTKFSNSNRDMKSIGTLIWRLTWKISWCVFLLIKQFFYSKNSSTYLLITQCNLLFDWLSYLNETRGIERSQLPSFSVTRGSVAFSDKYGSSESTSKIDAAPRFFGLNPFDFIDTDTKKYRSYIFAVCMAVMEI